MTYTPKFQYIVNLWKNEHGYNTRFHDALTHAVNAEPCLKEHRDWIEQHQHGFGDRAFHGVWLMLVEQMPKEFNFLEIGVFKGQVLSLVSFIARECEKTASIYGITTLTNTRDERCQYPTGDYSAWINEIRNRFNQNDPAWTLLVGTSRDQAVTNKARELNYNIVYIDGSHDYKEVVHDINTYSDCVSMDGFLVMDDSSNFLNIGTCWPGLEEVSQAVRDVLEPDERFKHLFACGHLRVFQRIK